ncbi:hypothetical protein M513_05715 [Trichuris suis]|uniref:Uncharacterized protein n=1 Tax=Trichuris suis TaxID=68888 RepID=A0A085M8A5_9BILA|nr:hypothetical protein M513_05715 [Trichuris suis]
MFALIPVLSVFLLRRMQYLKAVSTAHVHPPEFTANEVGITCDRNWPKSWKQLVRKPCKLGKLPSESQNTAAFEKFDVQRFYERKGEKFGILTPIKCMLWQNEDEFDVEYGVCNHVYLCTGKRQRTDGTSD